MARPVRRTFLEPWKIALIVLGVVIVLALVIGLLVYFLIYDQKLFFYNATFRINNVPYNPNLQRQTSAEFRELSTTIETVVNQAFRGTSLEKRVIQSHVISLSPDNGGVLADMVLVFRFIASDSKKVLWESINNILLRRLQSSTWPLSIDISSYHLTGKCHRWTSPWTRWHASSQIIKTDEEQIQLQTLRLSRRDHIFELKTHMFPGCGTRMDRSAERISGGNIAGEGEWPWQASLQLNGIHRCGASLISEDWLVTAAHCFRGVKELKSWTASFGANLRTPTEKRKLHLLIIHEFYAENVMNHEYDIAVVQLSSPVRFTSAVHSVCLPEATHVFPDNTTCYVTGWGALRDDGPSVSELRQTKVEIISNNICNRREVYNGVISPGMLCAGYLKGGSDACQGDSGGPLVTPDPRNIWYLVGIVSWGDECAKPNKPGVYTRVTYYRDWIFTHTGV